MSTTLAIVTTTLEYLTATASPTEEAEEPDIIIPGDEDTRIRWYNILLWFPFVFIPTSIILYRSIKYSWRYYKAKKAGQDASNLGLDPLMELSLTITNNHDKLRQIKRIRKEQELIKKWKETNRQSEQLQDAVASPRHNATDFLRQLQKRTTQTWSERLSPEAVRRLFSVTRFGRLWMIFQVLCTTIAIINYILYTYFINKKDIKSIKRLDVALAFFFLIDYLVSLYTAEDRLRFYFNLTSLVDLLSIVPTFVYFLVRDSGSYVWFLGLLRILRATRILRTYRLISFSQTEEKRELTILALTFVNFLFLSASVIHAFESLFERRDGNGVLIRDNPALTNWHDSLYYIMVTFSTIGFGDLTPNTIPSRMLVMCLIVLVIIFVPLQTGKLSELYNSTNVYQRAKFTPYEARAHVVVSGDINESSIIDFCREYFANNPLGHLVILSDEIPSMAIRRLLRHPYYRNRVHYLCGSPLMLPDLKRSGASTATGMFLLTNRLNKDSNLLMQALTVKTTYPGLPIFTQCHDIRSIDLSTHCGVDRLVCVDEIKVELMCRNCFLPGLLPFIMNLVSTYQDTEEIEDGWKKEYHYGSLNHIFTFKLPSGFVGRTFEEACLALYNSFGITLYALFHQGDALFAPIGTVITENHIAVCIGTGGEDLVVRISVQFNEIGEVINEINSLSPSMKSPPKDWALSQEILASRAISDFALPGVNEQTSPVSSADTESVNDMESPSASASSPVLKNHLILCGDMTSRALRHFVRTTRSICQKTPILVLMDHLPTIDGVWEDIVAFNDIHLEKGSPLKKSNLIRVGVETCKRVVIFVKEDSELPDANAIFLAQFLKEVRFVVELVNGHNTKFFSMKESIDDSYNVRMESVLNDYSISVHDRISMYKQVRGNSEESTLVKLRKFVLPSSGPGSGNQSLFPLFRTSDRSNERYNRIEDNDEEKEEPVTNTYLQHLETQAELNESGFSPFPTYHFDRHYAAGMVFTSSFLHCLLCQSYFRPYTISQIKEIAKRLRLVPVLKEWDKKKYGFLFMTLLGRGMVVLGIYRRGNLWTYKHEKLPYVYTNCKALDTVSSDDCLFVVEST